MANSTRKTRGKKRSQQDARPYAEFPLTAHASGRWYKKHKGVRFFFGKVEDGCEAAFKK